MKKEKKHLITCKVQVDNLSPESRKIIVQCQQYEQECVNRILARWLADSLAAGKDADLRIFLGLYKRWKDGGGKGEKPKTDFYAVENSFQVNITRELQEAYPEYNCRCINLTVQRVIGCIKNNVSHTGGLKLWQAVLLSRERLAASEGGIAIPFDSANGTLEWDNGEVWLGARIDRYEVEGKVNAKSNLVSMRFNMDRSKKRHRMLVEQAAQGLRKWAASKIKYDGRARKFYVCLTVEDDPCKPMNNIGKTATILAPEEGCCWKLAIGDRIVEIGSGRSIGYLRMRLDREKKVRMKPDFEGVGRIGHGRKRMLKGFSRFSGQWNNVTRTLNSQAVARIVKECVAEGVAFVDVSKPTSKSLLNTVGGIGPAWPTYDFCEKLDRKAKEQGITVRFSDGKSDETSSEDAICGECVA